jgi:hypothetical protein
VTQSYPVRLSLLRAADQRASRTRHPAPFGSDRAGSVRLLANLLAGPRARGPPSHAARRLAREAHDLNLPVEPGVRDGRDALVRWAVLLDGVIP